MPGILVLWLCPSSARSLYILRVHGNKDEIYSTETVGWNKPLEESSQVQSVKQLVSNAPQKYSSNFQTWCESSNVQLKISGSTKKHRETAKQKNKNNQDLHEIQSSINTSDHYITSVSLRLKILSVLIVLDVAVNRRVYSSQSTSLVLKLKLWQPRWMTGRACVFLHTRRFQFYLTVL